MQEKYDLAVAYRIYPKISSFPAKFSNDKYKLSEFCLKSFKKSLGKLKVKMFVLLDNCPPEYEELFLKYFDAEDIEFIRVDGIGNLPTFRLQIEILLKQKLSEIIYFAEDDYFYLSEQFPEMIEFLNENSDADFVSPYDHLDLYTSHIHNYESIIKISKNRHWRTAGSICLTFLTTKKTLQKTHETFQSYSEGNTDWGMWLSLTNDGLNHSKILIKSLKSPGNIKNLIRSFKTNKNQILHGKTWKLWVPIPAIATHMEKTCLSPAMDWEKLMNENIDE